MYGRTSPPAAGGEVLGEELGCLGVAALAVAGTVAALAVAGTVAALSVAELAAGTIVWTIMKRAFAILRSGTVSTLSGSVGRSAAILISEGAVGSIFCMRSKGSFAFALTVALSRSVSGPMRCAFQALAPTGALLLSFAFVQAQRLGLAVRLVIRAVLRVAVAEPCLFGNRRII